MNFFQEICFDMNLEHQPPQCTLRLDQDKNDGAAILNTSSSSVLEKADVSITNNSKGFAYSSSDYIIFGNVSDKSLTLNTMCMTKVNRSNQQTLEKSLRYRIEKETFHKKIFFVPISETSFAIILFTTKKDNPSSSQLFPYIFKFETNFNSDSESLKDPIVCSLGQIFGATEKDEYIKDIELLFSDTDFKCIFSLIVNTCSKDTTHVRFIELSLKNITYSSQNTNIARYLSAEISKTYKPISTKSSNVISTLKSYVGLGTADIKQVLAIKYIENNLIAYVTEDFKATIFNIKTNTIIAQYNLVREKRQQSVINFTKIDFYEFPYNQQQFEKTKRKELILFFYVQYDNTSYIVETFKIMFDRIPSYQADYQEYLDRLLQISAEHHYRNMDLGEQCHISNSTLFPLKGALIDSYLYQEKLYFVYENDLLQQYLNNSYEFLVLSLDLSNNEGPDAFSSNYVIHHDLKLKNFTNIINQIDFFSDKSKISDLMTCLISSNGILSENNLLYYSQRFFEINPPLNKTIRSENINIQNQSINNHFSKLATNSLIQDTNNSRLPQISNKTQLMEILNSTKKSGRSNQKVGLKSIEESNTQRLFIEHSCANEKNNRIVGLGKINIRTIDSLCVVREKGLSIIRFTGGICEAAGKVFLSEYEIRNILIEKFKDFNDQTETDNFEISKNLHFYQNQNCKNTPEKAFDLFLAFIRILKTEEFVLLESGEKLKDFIFNNSNGTYQNFLDSILNHTNMVHSVFSILDRELKNLFLIYLNIIIKEIGETISKVREYLKFDTVTSNFTAEMLGIPNKPNLNKLDNSSIKINYTLVQIIESLSLNKIKSIYHIVRDCLAACKWIIQLIKLDLSNSSIYKLSQFQSYCTELTNLFYECHSTYLYSQFKISLDSKESNSIVPNLSSLNLSLDTSNLADSCQIMAKLNKDITVLAKVIVSNLSVKGICDIAEYSNKYIDTVIKSVWINSDQFGMNLQVLLHDILGYKRLSISKTSQQECFSLLSMILFYEQINEIWINDPNLAEFNEFFGISQCGKESSLELIFLKLYLSIYVKAGNNKTEIIQILLSYFEKVKTVDATQFREFENFLEYNKFVNIGQTKKGISEQENQIYYLRLSFLYLERALISIWDKEFESRSIIDDLIEFYFITLLQNVKVIFDSDHAASEIIKKLIIHKAKRGHNKEAGLWLISLANTNISYIDDELIKHIIESYSVGTASVRLSHYNYDGVYEFFSQINIQVSKLFQDYLVKLINSEINHNFFVESIYKINNDHNQLKSSIKFNYLILLAKIYKLNYMYKECANCYVMIDKLIEKYIQYRKEKKQHINHNTLRAMFKDQISSLFEAVKNFTEHQKPRDLIYDCNLFNILLPQDTNPQELKSKYNLIKLKFDILILVYRVYPKFSYFEDVLTSLTVISLKEDKYQKIVVRLVDKLNNLFTYETGLVICNFDQFVVYSYIETAVNKLIDYKKTSEINYEKSRSKFLDILNSMLKLDDRVYAFNLMINSSLLETDNESDIAFVFKVYEQSPKQFELILAKSSCDDSLKKEFREIVKSIELS